VSGSAARTVLIVDDDRLVGESLRKILTTAGYAVVVAGDGESALDVARAQPVDVVLLDLVMPRMDGIKTLRYLRQLRPDLGVVILAGEVSPAARRAALEYGAAVVMLKPPDLEELLRVIARLAQGESE
jgi:DNA-binding response OmpR family regulator